MKTRGAATMLALLCLALVAGVALAGSSPNYAIDWDVIAGGGNEMASAHYAIKSTTGQTAIGPAASAQYGLGAGYWYGIGKALYDVYLPLILRNF